MYTDSIDHGRCETTVQKTIFINGLLWKILKNKEIKITIV